MPKGDLGAALYKTWSPEQKKKEIEKLVIGYRNGLPVGILCRMAEAIAGSQKQARKILHCLMKKQERIDAIARESGGMKQITEEFLL